MNDYLSGIISLACIIGIPILVVFIKEMIWANKYLKEAEAEMKEHLIEVHHFEPEMLEGCSYSVLSVLDDCLDENN